MERRDRCSILPIELALTLKILYTPISKASTLPHMPVRYFMWRGRWECRKSYFLLYLEGTEGSVAFFVQVERGPNMYFYQNQALRRSSRQRRLPNFAIAYAERLHVIAERRPGR